MLAVEALLGHAGRIAEREPGSLLDYQRAVEQPHALVGDVQGEAVVLAGLELPEVHVHRLDLKSRRIDDLAGHASISMSRPRSRSGNCPACRATTARSPRPIPPRNDSR